ncbi:MAG: hypothetical protein KA314_17670 [Chloroflexi bacterium]|nr:hypothetical protein [Chloroflexota bacterium]MBP8057661.1 hypothetical protein [Chloroflexota bacterium]
MKSVKLQIVRVSLLLALLFSLATFALVEAVDTHYGADNRLGAWVMDGDQGDVDWAQAIAGGCQIAGGTCSGN